MKRRNFLSSSALAGLGLGMGCKTEIQEEKSDAIQTDHFQATVVSTWNNQKANEAAWKVIGQQGKAIDAVEAGVKIPEADPNDQSVGYGGRPDRDGNVTLDACIMDETGNAGSVCFLKNIKHPISVARKVMDETPHVLLAGQGAQEFALSKGFETENLLTEKSKEEWKKWLETAEYKPKINIELHDTIGMLALDEAQDLSGACTTSGLAYKLAGRVGDSPIIGAGLFVDNEVGAATSTGMGEAVLKSVGSFLVVELMRQGKTPAEACEEAVMRIVRKQPNYKEIQVGYLAMDRAGNVGAFAIQPGFVYAVTRNGNTEVIDAKSYLS
ncbi:MAG: N(4)-(beta-N-acetylglucosaminyl)-L-asparaginase [Bacteroidota bacterium]